MINKNDVCSSSGAKVILLRLFNDNMMNKGAYFDKITVEEAFSRIFAKQQNVKFIGKIYTFIYKTHKAFIIYNLANFL